MNFGKKQTRGQKADAVEARLGKTTKGTAEKARPSVKVRARPTGGLKPSGAKASVTWKF
jgi:hypothetical protein